MGAFRWCRRTKNFLYREMRFSPLNLPRFDHFWNWKKELHHRSPDPEKAKRNIGLRCCSANDTMCTSWSDESRYLTSATGCSYNGGAIHGKPMTYSDAEAFCKDKGQALCPKEMLQSYSRGSCEWSEHMGHSVKSCAGGCRGSAVLEGLNPCWHNSRNMYAKDEE